MLRLIGFSLLVAASAAAEPLTVGSLNLAMVKDADSIIRQINAARGLSDADVLLFQEVVSERGKPSVAEEIAARLNRYVIFASPDGETTKSGIAIVSRLPLLDRETYKLKQQNLIFRSRARVALAATVITADGPMRIINTHLDTRINPGERIAQLQPALEDASCFLGPSVIGGDFNTNDMQWVSNVVPVPFPGWQVSRIKALMLSRGFSTPFQIRKATHNFLGMQLDWIFTTGLSALAHGIEPIPFSDHKGIWTRLNAARPLQASHTR
jgi:endonuclease/exonuclease/phosphatase family metal-dependent hydrolase